jgi:hypothetical protein
MNTDAAQLLLHFFSNQLQGSGPLRSVDVLSQGESTSDATASHQPLHKGPHTHGAVQSNLDLLEEVHGGLLVHSLEASHVALRARRLRAPPTGNCAAVPTRREPNL